MKLQLCLTAAAAAWLLGAPVRAATPILELKYGSGSLEYRTSQATGPGAAAAPLSSTEGVDVSLQAGVWLWDGAPISVGLMFGGLEVRNSNFANNTGVLEFYLMQPALRLAVPLRYVEVYGEVGGYFGNVFFDPGPKAKNDGMLGLGWSYGFGASAFLADSFGLQVSYRKRTSLLNPIESASGSSTSGTNYKLYDVSSDAFTFGLLFRFGGTPHGG